MNGNSFGPTDVGYIFMIVAGAVVGWLAAFVLRVEQTARGLPLNIAVGMAGALVAGLAIGPMLGIGGLGDGHYGVPALIISLLGAVIALVPLNLLRNRFFG